METIVIMIAVFGLVGSSVFFLLAPKGEREHETVNRRLEAIRRGETAVTHRPRGETFWERMAKLFLGSDRLDPQYTGVRRLLHQADYTQENAVLIYWGVRFFASIACATLAFLIGITGKSTVMMLIVLMAIGALGGFNLPVFYVKRKARARKLELQETLPDTLDLLVVCSEAGMGVDSSFNRVGNEQADAGFAIGREFKLMASEVRAGVSRRQALQRLTARIDLDDFRNLVTFLNQTEEFGGSIARSLRVYAGTMREKRSQRAEELARKLVIKLLFPLVFLILPALFMVVLAEPLIGIGEIFAPN